MPTEPNIDAKAAAFALLIHGVQTLFIMISGVVSLVLLPILNAKKRKQTSSEIITETPKANG